MARTSAFAFLVAVAVGSLSPVALADEVVKFTNGAEMPVASHTVEKGMVKLDLGNNSFIAFPMAMVDKIVNSGRDVFLNPSFHLSNQAVSNGAVSGTGSPFGNGGSGGVIGGSNVANSGVQKGGAQLPPNANGTMLGEAADSIPQETRGELQGADVNKRRIYNPQFTPPPGSMPQVILPPNIKNTGRMTISAPRAPQPPTQSQPQPQPPDNTPDPPVDPPDNNN